MTYRVVSLFAGAGGLDLGFKMSGHFDLVWANDVDPDAVATHRANFGAHAVLRDIKDVDSTQIPDCEVILGGFPCQGFSVANTGRRVDDDRNELYLQMLRIVREKNPLMFVAENVKGLAQMAGGEILRRIVLDFERLGYNVVWRILNAADYGVPQKRERVIIVGVRTDVQGTFEFPSPTHSERPQAGVLPWVTVGEALRHFPDPDGIHAVLNHTYSRYKLRFNGYIGHREIDPSRPAPTVTGRGDNKGGVVVLHHPSNERRMSVRELAAVQSFPDDFFFDCNQSAAYRLIGNAVPPLLGRHVADATYRALECVDEGVVSVGADA